MQKSKYTKDGISKETCRLLFDEKEQNKKEHFNEIFTIEMSSLYDRKPYYIFYNFFKKVVDMYFYEVNYFNLHKNMFGKEYIFKNSDVEFWFDYLENYLKKILRNEDTYVKKEMIFDLKHNLRYCSCFYKNMIISANIENSFFVIGLIKYDDGDTHLHSFVEYKDYVIGYTKNLIMPKEKYFEFLKIKELQRVDTKSLINMYNVLVENRILNTASFMSTFGNEIMNDLDRNPQLIKRNTDKPDFSCLFY